MNVDVNFALKMSIIRHEESETLKTRKIDESLSGRILKKVAGRRGCG
jgi:hypothetical protein